MEALLIIRRVTEMMELILRLLDQMELFYVEQKQVKVDLGRLLVARVAN